MSTKCEAKQPAERESLESAKRRAYSSAEQHPIESAIVCTIDAA